MLTRLALHHFVIVKHVEIEFSEKFCALTGETGAGKSLLIGALALLAGGRASTNMVRAPAEAAEVSAAFDISDNRVVQDYLEQHDLAGSGEETETLLLRRVIGGRKSAAYINGRQAPLTQLGEVAALLLDICGQHAHYSLRSNSAHRQLLDSYANATDLAAKVRTAHHAWRQAEEQYTEAVAGEQQAQQKREMLNEVLAELNALNFSPQKWEAMNNTLTRTANMSDLQNGYAQILQLLQGDEATAGGIQSALAQIRRQLTLLEKHDAHLAKQLPIIDDVESLVGDVARTLTHYSEQLHNDPEALAEAEHFIGECQRAARKYGVIDAARLDEFIIDKQEELAALPTAVSVQQLAQAATATRKTLNSACQKLSKQRQTAAKTLCREVNELLKQLAMPKAKLSVQFTNIDPPNAHGSEKIALQIATRANTAAGNIGDIASGGELSRLGLAIQIAASQVRGQAVAVFDEVDAGIGGGTAGGVGSLLRRLGETRQVLCVTHLPQVAAQAHAHWRVGGNETLAVQPLSDKQRIEEIARMHSGEVITDAARRHAAELLQSKHSVTP